MTTVSKFVSNLLINAKRLSGILSGAASDIFQIGIMSVISTFTMKILDVMRKEFTKKMTASLIT